ncbi:UDP-glucose 6-dehydrogenase [Bacillus sp. TS-2]|nr:UDP-glucose 6-dehydrogenase [Bacillus sp. TS-2]
MKIAVVGTGYVGLVTGVALSDIGHTVTCIDVDAQKVEKMKAGLSPIYEPGLEDLMKKNYQAGRLIFTSNHFDGFDGADAIYIAVGTPQKDDGTADLRFIKAVCHDIAKNITAPVVVVTKSTVPIGTNEIVKRTISNETTIPVEVVSNPEFLREGSAVFDTFNGDRIVIGSDSEAAANLIEEINKPFNIPVYKTDLRSSEMIKYASNAFLAVKISFINEIANLCDKLGANVEDVAFGMGKDNRIGEKFLNAGIGYGGSCFPKDTSALVQIAEQEGMDFALLKEVMNVNKKQQSLLVNRLKERFETLKGKKVAMLGLAFKPNTDDMREAASIVIAEQLVLAGASVTAYDPIATENAKSLLPEAVNYVETVKDALMSADVALIVTEWDELKTIDLNLFEKYMKEPILFDGRNCFELELVEATNLEYHSIGRPSVDNKSLQLS